MKILVYYLLIILLFISCFLFVPNVFSKLNGSPGGKTGSPLDGDNCTDCHSGTVNSGAGMLSIATSIPAQGYISGQTYSITVQLIQTPINRFGFEITSEEGNFGSNKTGTFLITNSSETKLTNNNASVTHKQGGTSGSNMKIWTMDWIAPQSGVSGGVTFYASAITANDNGNNGGDNCYTTTSTFFETNSSSINEKKNSITAFLNPTSKDIMINSSESIKINCLKIFSIRGKLVFSELDVILPRILNVNNLKTGTYILNFDNETKRVIIP